MSFTGTERIRIFSLILLLNAVGIAIATNELQSLCSNEFLRIGHSCYFFSAYMKTWQDSFFDCRRRNSTLTTIESAWEDNTLRTYLNKPQLVRLNRWIGGEYNWVKGEWIWGSSGQPMTYTGFPPNDITLGGEWQCAYLSASLLYRWNFASCFSIMHYICKAPQMRPHHKEHQAQRRST